MKRILLTLLVLPVFAFAQIGIGTDDPQATLDVRVATPATPTASAGIGVPQVDVLPSSGNRSGQLVLLTTDNLFYYYNGTIWAPVSVIQDISGIATNASNISTNTSAIALLNTTNIYGDIKTGIQSVDHNGWIKLDGRLISTLTTDQQTNASNLGLTGSLPNAANSFLVQNGSTLGAVSGSNTKTISQANLPNLNFSANITSATTGDQWLSTVENFGGGGNYHDVKRDKTRGSSGWFGRVTNGYDDDPNDYYSTYTTSTHNHTIIVQSGGSNSPLNITPQSLSVNMFIYLGV